jgi:vacuolar-type H+-ATPase subunit H
VLAQRTAAMAVQEARQEADRIAASARAEANAIVAQAEDMARRTIEETQGGIRAELTQLESARDHLRGDISALQRHLDQERVRLRASLAEALDVVETTLAPAPPAPDVAEVAIPPRRVPKATIPPIDEPVPAAAPTNGYLGEPEHFDIDLDALDRERLAVDAVVEAPAPEPEPEAEPEAAPYAPTAFEPSPSVENAPVGLVADGPFDDLADDSIAVGPLTFEAPPPPTEWATPPEVAEAAPEPVPEPQLEPEPDLAYEVAEAAEDSFDEQDTDDEAGEDEDPFIAELRRAITDTQPLGPREEGDVDPDSQGDPLMHGDVLDGSRLGSLLRRRR